ncbi:ankyrin repeat domain-containing protein 28 [Colletotrichum asianum]|uniref:Ankyrin repeat domain-containing protein 28 n=1 Tax=Colletotrichum asianum TaxID=702518 RepID=A0A8H3WH85_9PEZI|nr:ankyrin repeat domain-containing protein 28 [Colletotrichum asianum]
MSRLTYSLIAIGLAGCAAADGWDDFTNNMATDLAPIISLFGEQATKQYLSESITWLDYFIFAMAPIGILTALVSAIRVCGSSSLRAFIGRAKEGAGSVEAELLSSTSHDVCEIYNSGGITRVFGRPKILEFVHNLDALNRDSAQMDSTAGISTFQEHIQTMPDDGEWEVLHSCRSNFPPEEYAPNLSHNVGIKRLDDNWFALVAVLGFVLQGGVLGLAWTATYFLRWEKEGAAPASYACPMAMAGTALLCIGVFCCAYLVGESTQERIYVRNHHTNSALRTATVIYWLQPTQVLGEQNFECFCYLDDGGAGSLSRYVSSWKKQKKTSSSYVWIVVSITAVGFVLQFVGFRGIHSAVSMAQLGAALIMSIARASLRTQRLDNQNNMLCNSQRIVKGYELDWLAVRMAEKELEVLNKTRPAKPIFWLFCGLSEPRRRMAKKRRRPSPEKTIGDVHDVNRIMVYRRRLAELTNLESFEFSSQILARHFTDEMIAVREIAGKLASSIESVANVVFMTTRSKAKVKPFWQDADILSWAVKCALRNGHEIVVKIFRAQVEAEEVGFMDRIQLQGNDHMTAVFARAYSKAVGRTFLSTHVLSLGGHYETRPKPWKGPIRIAILDQGADTANVVCCGILGVPNTTNEHLIIDQKSWVDDSKNIGDTIHGTTVTSLVLRFGPKAEVYVAQVSRKSRVSIEDAGRIVRAIEHARDEWNVDMFVLPFGFRSVDQNIKRLLQDVRQKGKIIMAAAKAIGYNARRSYPANSPHVIGIHAVDGRGKHCEIAPAPVEGDHDFSTLGMGLERSLEGASEMVSGNSYAVCVAAGIAASFLEFARYKLTLDEEDQKWICSTDGMREMLLLMSTKIDGYNFLVPWELFSQRITTEEICEIILMTIRKRRKEIGQH